MLRRSVLAIVLLLAALSVPLAEGAARRTPGKAYRADRFDVQADVQEDRSLRVEETVVFRFEDPGFTSVWRDIPGRGTDGIADVVARMDGVVLPEGRGPGYIEIRRGSSVRVTWRFAPTTGVHEFALAYRLLGVASKGPSTDVVHWIALPEEHAYPIGEAQVTLRVPGNAVQSDSVRVRPQKAVVTAGPGGVAITARHLATNASIRIDLDVAPGALSPAPPQWQAEVIDRQRRGPWLLLVAGVILAAGLGWLAAFSAGWSQPRDYGETGGAAAGPPRADLPAAAAARLAGFIGRMPQLAATVVELASRGVVRIEERPRAARVLGRDYHVSLVAQPASPLPHEAAALELLFGRTPVPGARTSWRHLLKQMQHRGGRFASSVLDTLRHEGYVDPDRVTARRVLGRAALAVGLVGIMAVVLAIALAPLFGAWTVVIPGSIFVVTVALAVSAARFRVFTRRGEAEARTWRRFLTVVTAAARADSASRALTPSWLHWAVAIGVGHLALKRIPSSQYSPEWFTAVDAGSHDSLVAFISSTGSWSSHGADGSAAAAAAGAAAAGGGASGAS